MAVDLSDDPFAYGYTEASTEKPPTLTLPDDEEFGGQTPVIADSVGPVLAQVVKVPPSPYLVETDSGLVPREFPPLLTITLSEPIFPRPTFKPDKAQIVCEEV